MSYVDHAACWFVTFPSEPGGFSYETGLGLVAEGTLVIRLLEEEPE